jgi:hypothetical protein
MSKQPIASSLRSRGQPFADAAQGPDAQTRTATYDDGKFVRTALIIDEDGPNGSQSVDVIRIVDGRPVRLCQINLFDYRDEDSLIVDVIDVDARFTRRRALVFSPTAGRSELAVPKEGNLVSVDFRTKGR